MIRGQPDPLEQLDHKERGVPGESLGRKDNEANKDYRVHPELLEIMEILDFLDPLASLDLLAHLETLYVGGFGVIVLHICSVVVRSCLFNDIYLRYREILEQLVSPVKLVCLVSLVIEESVVILVTMDSLVNL